MTYDEWRAAIAKAIGREPADDEPQAGRQAFDEGVTVDDAVQSIRDGE
jgi:hypothetical protein